MSTSRPDEIRLRDPLSEVTRNERRILLGASAIGIVIVKTGLVPSKISALGIEFTQTDQRSLLLAVAAIIFYFLIAFLIYAGSDFVAWRLAYQQALMDSFLEQRKRMSGEANGKDALTDIISLGQLKLSPAWYSLSKPLSAIRALFEFLIPIIISIYAMIILFRAPV